MITPGPVVITVAFIGYLVAGPLGGLAAAVADVSAVPGSRSCIAARWFQRMQRQPARAACVDGVTAAATGAIAGRGIRARPAGDLDLPTAAIAVATLLLLIRFRKAPEPLVIALAGIVGIALTQLT